MTEDIEMHAETKDMDWIRVTSMDGFSFIVRRKVANISGTMRNMLDEGSNFSEAITKTCQIEQRGIVAEKLLEYMAFRAYWESAVRKEDPPIQEFMERLPPEIVLELLLAADYQEL